MIWDSVAPQATSIDVKKDTTQVRPLMLFILPVGWNRPPRPICSGRVLPEHNAFAWHAQHRAPPGRIGARTHSGPPPCRRKKENAPRNSAATAGTAWADAKTSITALAAPRRG